jgi:hypothetical protein
MFPLPAGISSSRVRPVVAQAVIARLCAFGLPNIAYSLYIHHPAEVILQSACLVIGPVDSMYPFNIILSCLMLQFASSPSSPPPSASWRHLSYSLLCYATFFSLTSLLYYAIFSDSVWWQIVTDLLGLEVKPTRSSWKLLSTLLYVHFANIFAAALRTPLALLRVCYRCIVASYIYWAKLNGSTWGRCFK